MQYNIIKGKSKNGKDYEALEIVVGEYRKLIFMSKIEMMYIKGILNGESEG